MKTFSLFIIFLLLPFIGSSQNISGKWHGTIGTPNSNNPNHSGYIDISIIQKGDDISGSMVVSLNGGNHVEHDLSGKIYDNNITWKVLNVTSDKVVDGTPYWCLQRFRGKLVRYANGTISIEGTSETYAMATVRDHVIRNDLSPCALSNYKLDKVLDSPAPSTPVPTKSGIDDTILNISGQVIDKQNPNNNLNATIDFSTSPSATSQQEIIRVNTDGSGYYKALIKPNSVYLINVSSRNYKSVETRIETARGNITKNFFLDGLVNPKLEERQILKNVLFDLQSAILLPQSYSELDKLAAFMINNPSKRIRLEGHTDAIKTSSAEKDLELSQKRVESVKAYLVKKEVSPDRIQTIGYGHSRPVCEKSPCDENRRVELVIL